jgi:NAD(P)-dependent dehydrogenase (short-subunit alcohol dehydrogenase family)
VPHARPEELKLDQVAAIVAQAVAAFGRLDVAFNNAGIQVTYAGSADEHAEDFDYW